MVDEWRTREIVNQTLLFFALGVRESFTGSRQPAIEYPRPLPPVGGGRIEQQLRGVCEDIVRKPKDPEPLKQRVKGVFTSIAGMKLDKPPRWKIGDVVAWWIASSEAVARWKESATRQNLGDRGSVAGSRGVRDPFEEWLWNATIGCLQVDDDEEYPPVWCATNSEVLRLAEHQLKGGRPKSWEREASGPEESRLSLLEWCGDPRREVAADVKDTNPRAVDAWAEDYEVRHRCFARLGLRLLRRRCQFAPEHQPTVDTMSNWLVVQSAHSPSARRILRRPLMTVDAAENSLILPGFLVSPWPANIIKQCCKAVFARDTRSASFDRAIAAAVNAWRSEDRSFGPIEPWDLEGNGDPGRDRLSDAVERLAALARLAVFEEELQHGDLTQQQPSPKHAEEGCQLFDALAVEGFVFRRADAHGEANRWIPVSVGGVTARQGKGSRITLARIGSQLTVDVGVVAAPARCPDDLVAAIEELDWWLWAVDVLRDAGKPIGHGQNDKHPDVEGGWEPLKRGLLELDPESPEAAKTLAVAFTALHTARLSIVSIPSAGDVQAAEVRSLLTARLESVEIAVIRLLLSIDQAGQGGLYPPRGLDGRIDLALWTQDRCCDDPRVADWEVVWARAPERFGRQLRELRCENGRFVTVFSAGEAQEADVRILNGMGIISGARLPWASLWRPLWTRVLASLGDGHPLDSSAVIAEMRRSWNGEEAEPFDRLVQLAIEQQPRAVETLQLLQADSRFNFACHPAIELCGQRVSLRPAADGDAIEWRDDGAVPIDQHIEVFFSTDPAKARRVVSRGRPVPGSAEACAATLEAVVRNGVPEAVAAARVVREATDRRRMFGAAAPDPIMSAIAAANVVARAGPDETWTADAFQALASWCKAVGGDLVPAEWHPMEGAQTEGLDVTRVGFHSRVPLGRVVVTQFGVKNAEGVSVASLEAHVSAGPEPEGYREVVEKLEGLPDESELVARFRRNVVEFPRRVLGGQTATAAQGLFDLAWKAVESASGRDDIKEAAHAVHRLLERSCNMVLFEPKSISDVQEGWLRTRAGGVPRGNRLELVRPGVRTRDNKLVCPAIVETE